MKAIPLTQCRTRMNSQDGLSLRILIADKGLTNEGTPSLTKMKDPCVKGTFHLRYHIETIETTLSSEFRRIWAGMSLLHRNSDKIADN